MSEAHTQLTHGSLFAGIGGFDEGFERAGFRTIWQVEKEPFCIAVLKTHFPNAERYHDVLKCGHDRKHKLRTVDVVTAGFPCQDLSVAGKRAGLEGARSGLFWEVVRILGELRATWFVLENVPGLFSSGEGRDFGIVLNALDELGYGVAWGVLNSQFFGVAQRRRRVFIVGRFGKPCPAEVLFESEGGGWDSQDSGETWADVAVPLTSGTGVAGSSAGRRCEDDFNLALSITENQRGEVRTSRLAPQLSCSGGKPGSGSDNLVAGFSAGQSSKAGSLGYREDQSPTLRGSSSGTNQVPSIVQQAISSKWAKGSSGPAGDEHHNLTVCIQDARGQREKRQNGIGIDDSGGPMYTLDGTSQHAVARTDLEYQERSRQQFNSAGEVDGRLRGTDDVSSPSDTNRVRDFTGLPKGLDSARYRALGNAVTTNVAYWLGRRIVESCER